MAIFAAGPTFLDPQVIDGVLYTIGAQGQLVAMTSTTNRKKMKGGSIKRASTKKAGSDTGSSAVSTGFQNLDDLIRFLDALYDTLPNQLEWEVYAGNITDRWQLCANCQPDGGAKKLFRQVNYNRNIMGNSIITVPTDNTEYQPTEFGGMVYYTARSTGTEYAYVDASPVGPDFFICIQAGKIMGNPWAVLPAAQLNHEQFSGVLFDWVKATCLELVEMPPLDEAYAIYANACVGTPDGAPGFTANGFVGIVN